MGTGRTAESYGYLLIVVSPADPRASGPNTIDNASVGSCGRESETSQGGDIVEQGLEEGAFEVLEGWSYLRRASVFLFLIGVYGDVMVCGTSAWSLGQRSFKDSRNHTDRSSQTLVGQT